MHRAILVLSLAMALPAISFDRAHGQTLQQIIEGAKKEGQVRIYSAMNKGTAKAAIDAFRKKYPFVAKVDHHRATARFSSTIAWSPPRRLSFLPRT
ncbi:MAG: hypothetical protein ACREP8_13695, partial [Candidatus Binatia bacterium]